MYDISAIEAEKMVIDYNATKGESKKQTVSQVREFTLCKEV